MKFWIPSKTDMLRQLWGDGMSGVEIAKQLGCSRNSVISKASRLGLGLRGTQKAANKTPIYRPSAPAVEQGEQSDYLIAESQRKSLFDLTLSTCRWPVGDPRDAGFFFCGAIPVENSPYCPSHNERAYQRRM